MYACLRSRFRVRAILRQGGQAKLTAYWFFQLQDSNIIVDFLEIKLGVNKDLSYLNHGATF